MNALIKVDYSNQEPTVSGRELHEFLEAGLTPAAEYDKGKCDSCSLLESCLPKALKNRVNTYIKEQL